MHGKKIKNDENNFKRFAYVSAMRYILVLILFIGGSVAAFALMMLASISQVIKAPSADEIATETAKLLKTYPEFVDWQRYSDRGIALWLPNTFEQFKVADVLEMAKGDVEDVPFPLGFAIDTYNQLPGPLHFVAFDRSTYLFSPYIRHINVLSTGGTEAMFDDFVGTVTEAVSGVDVLQAPEEFRTARYSGKSVITETQVGFRSFASVSYFIAHKGQFYMFVMQTSVDQVDESQAMMEKAIQSLWLYDE